MRTLDFSPLYRSTIGFDRVANLFDSITRSDQGQVSYPPYNIEVIGEDKYRISIAVAGFSDNELNIEAKQNSLTVSGEKEVKENQQQEYLHRGIAARSFERRFQLADFVRVDSASLENGLLHIDLHREVPEALKARTIAIGDKSSTKAVESKVA